MSVPETYPIGSARITKIPEMTLQDPGSSLFPQWNADAIQDAAKTLPADFFGADASELMLSTHSWLVQTGTQTVLIDTASGNDKLRPLNLLFNQLKTGWLDNLRATGVEPEDVDVVLLSHLHVDHVGWNTRLENGRWVPTFPNARYLFSEAEYQFYADPNNVRDPSDGIFADSVEPVVAAGLDQRIHADDATAIPGFAIIRTPGHSHDHFSFAFTSEGETAFFWGDVMHHPLQLARPDWDSVFCEEPAQATASRHKAIEFALSHQATVFTTHFAGSSAGKIRQDARGLSWQPL
ncbi:MULTISPECIES: MBL fold metallo-hydrolase [Rahnella]|jgi:glyoxylase-like metal-dependent hydrolase (beta-lactamase superfamily II)|uniref:Beta-lactamase domain protein n=1 Tax=Rahnella sp. (strain Y9602) TaxID=2703885 RepID=A0A0H3F6Q6_RAHSY|nr:MULTISPECIES: MBL fold metallo-hydrolase [Rahnella]AFE57170.1 beta-lactamase [Rahnella aquatilis HX2]AYA05938.1 MBL fold metallo-hydrolase [Rahnella aquatilis]ADW72589.1 beta-lactamase domain protein [Rahnella aceris]AZP49886.1 MBL fold metallo-hydrolase [Rahnella aquatilis]MCM2443603.1 MBL fold metallo-hydrolase [Rahnella sp. CG8]